MGAKKKSSEKKGGEKKSGDKKKADVDTDGEYRTELIESNPLEYAAPLTKPVTTVPSFRQWSDDLIKIEDWGNSASLYEDPLGLVSLPDDVLTRTVAWKRPSEFIPACVNAYIKAEEEIQAQKTGINHTDVIEKLNEDDIEKRTE